MKFRVVSDVSKQVLVLFTIVTALNTSCKKSDTPDSYYVKYEVNSSSIYTGGKLNVIVSDKDSSRSFLINTKAHWETVIGPVGKSFNASLGVSKSGSTDNTLKLYTQISVSINNEPFVLKKIDGSDIPRSSVTLNYIVGN